MGFDFILIFAIVILVILNLTIAVWAFFSEKYMDWDNYEKELASLYDQQREDLEEELETEIKIVFASIDKY